MTEVSTPAAGCGPVLCYDGDCGMCRGAVALLARLGLIPRERAAPLQSFDAEAAQRLLAAEAHNELAVLGPDGETVRSGIDGILWALEGSWIGPLLGWTRPRPIRRLLRLAYRLVAYNRRILSPAPPGIRCACEPDFRAGLRLGFAALAWFATLVLAELLDLALAVGTGALALAAAALSRPWPARADALGHAAWVGLLATAAALPHALAPHWGWSALPLAVLLRAARRRHAALGVRLEVAFAIAVAALGVSVLVASL